MLRTLIITGILCSVVGAGGLYWAKMDIRKAEAESAKFAQKHAGQTQEFIRQVNEQVAKGDASRLDLTWLRGNKTDGELAKEQHERLIADMDRLAMGAEPLYPDVLYGDNWKDEVEKYKTAVYARDMIQVAAIAVLIAGGLLIGIGLLLMVAAAMKNIWTHSDNAGKDEEAAKIKAEMKTAFADLAGTIEAKQKQFLTDLTASKPSLQTPEGVAIKFDESLNKFGKGLQNRLEGLISRIESAYNAGSKRNDEMLTHMNSLLGQQSGALEKMTAEIETLASSFMHELARQGKDLSDGVTTSLRENGEKLASETEALRKLVVEIEDIVATEPAGIKEAIAAALGGLRESLAKGISAALPVDTDRLQKLLEKIDTIAEREPAISVQTDVDGALDALRESIAGDQRRQLAEFLEGIQNVKSEGHSCDVGTMLEEAVDKLKNDLTAELAGIAADDSNILKSLESKIDTISISAGSHDQAEKLEGALDSIRKTIAAELAEIRDRSDSTLALLTQKIDTIGEGAASQDQRQYMEKALKSFKESLNTELADMAARDEERLQALTEKVDAIATATDKGERLDAAEILQPLRQQLASDIASAADRSDNELKELLARVESIMAVGPATDLHDELDETLDRFRQSIVADLGAAAQQDDKRLEALVEKIEAAMQKQGDSDLQSSLNEAITALHTGIAAELADMVQKETQELRALTERIEDVVTGTPGVGGKDLREALENMKAGIAAEIAAIRDSLSQGSRPDSSLGDKLGEVLEAVRSSNAAVGEAAGSIIRRVEELTNEQAGIISEQLASAISAEDTVFGDDTISRISDEASSAKEIVATTLGKAEAIEKNVEEACRQIWAIREYAAKQQERMERLQDGYDWTIIGNFCLRVIRCVDNLEDRIAELTAEGRDTQSLQLLRDELLFAMESSGVERFEVEVGSDFRGQEQRLKAQSQREVTDDPELLGKVAKVIRPGYQCYISEDTTKTVRPAEVRVYGETSVDEMVIGGSRK